MEKIKRENIKKRKKNTEYSKQKLKRNRNNSKKKTNGTSVFKNLGSPFTWTPQSAFQIGELEHRLMTWYFWLPITIYLLPLSFVSSPRKAKLVFCYGSYHSSAQPKVSGCYSSVRNAQQPITWWDRGRGNRNQAPGHIFLATRPYCLSIAGFHHWCCIDFQQKCHDADMRLLKHRDCL